MKYWDDLSSNDGFNGGSAIPEEAIVARQIYVTALNIVANHYGSNVRAIALNLAGLHNGLQISFVAKVDIPGWRRFQAYNFATVDEKGCDICRSAKWSEVARIGRKKARLIVPDLQMTEAINFCQEANLDSCMRISIKMQFSEVKFDRTVKSVIAAMQAEAEKECRR